MNSVVFTAADLEPTERDLDKARDMFDGFSDAWTFRGQLSTATVHVHGLAVALIEGNMQRAAAAIRTMLAVRQVFEEIEATQATGRAGGSR